MMLASYPKVYDAFGYDKPNPTPKVYDPSPTGENSSLNNKVIRG